MPVRKLKSIPVLLTWVLLLTLAVATAVRYPSTLQPTFLQGAISVAMPLVIGTAAATPSILSGGGGIDLSVGPLMGLTNILLVVALPAIGLSTALVEVPFLLLLGAVVGGTNGCLVAFLRVQPVVATLGTYLILNGLNLWLLPSPIGPAPSWVTALSGELAGVPLTLVPLFAVLVVWGLLLTSPFVRTLLAVGGDDRVAFSAGISVSVVRICAYSLGGVFASLAGIALTVVIQSADASVGTPFTLKVITAAALGGVSLAGGKGSLTGAILGALLLFLIQNLLTSMGISIFWQQAVFGTTLLAALVFNSAVSRAAIAAKDA